MKYFEKNDGFPEAGSYRRAELFEQGKHERLERLYREVINELDAEPAREGLVSTPSRMARSMMFLTEGYAMDPVEILKKAVFHENYQQMVLV